MSRPRKRAERRPYHHGDLRRALIEAAFKALVEGGLDQLSLRAVARSVGVSTRAPYRHFETKEQLLAAAAAEGFRRWVAFAGERIEAAGAEPLARLRAAVEAYVMYAVEHPAAFRVMYAPYAAVAESAPELLEARAGSHALMRQLIGAGQDAGVLRAGDPMQIALALWSAMHGLALLLIEGQLGRFDRSVSAAGVAGLVARLVFEGLMPRAS